MLNLGMGGKRDGWEFEYTAGKLAEGADEQRKFRLSRVEWWRGKYDETMAKIKESGISVHESVGVQVAAANYKMSATRAARPVVRVDENLEQDLRECHERIQAHTDAAQEYAGWVQVLRANAEQRVKCTHADWLYFFGRWDPADLDNA